VQCTVGLSVIYKRLSDEYTLTRYLRHYYASSSSSSSSSAAAAAAAAVITPVTASVLTARNLRGYNYIYAVSQLMARYL